MTTTRNHHRRSPASPPSLVMAAILAIVAGLLGAGGQASAAPGGDPTDPDPEIVITISDKVVPVYGDDVRFKVSAKGSSPVLYVYDGTTVLVGPVSMTSGVATPVAIPTLGRFAAGAASKVRVEVLDDIGRFGNVEVSFTPRFIPSQVNLSGTTVPYGSPIYGRLDPTVTTSIRPTGGTMAMRRGTLVRARYAIRTDGTFALNETGLLPGTYPATEFFYEGDASYAPNGAGTGMVVTDVVVTKMPATTEAALTAATVEQGSVVEVVASTFPTRADSTADVTGVTEVHAAPVGETAFTKIAEVAYPGGRQQVRLDISAWAATHPGSWTIRTVNHGTEVAEGSAQDNTLTVVPPPAPVEDTATALTLSAGSATVKGAPVRATASVTSDAGAVATGSVELRVDGRLVATTPLGADGRATASFSAPRVGQVPVTATYVGATGYAASVSPTRTLTGVKAASTTRLSLKKRLGRSAAKVKVAVSASLPAVGTVQVLRGRKVLATGRLVESRRGQVVLKVKGLKKGANRLRARFLGSPTVVASTSRGLVIRVPR